MKANCPAVWLVLACSTAAAFAGQGAGRLLYTLPNSTFIEQAAGDTVVTINDTSGSVASLQAALNSSRSSNPGAIIVIHLLTNATYSVNSSGLLLGSHECLVASGATLQAASSSVTVPLVQITSGATNVSVAGGTFDGNGANINGIYAPAATRINVDKVVVRNCGLDCILLEGNGNSTYDNEMSVTRCDCSGSPAHAGISIQNSTQTVVVDNNCHDSLAGIWLSCAWATVANNTCYHNTTGIDIAGGDDNVVANNACNNNGVGIHAGSSNNMLTSNVTGGNSTAGIKSDGSSNTFVDNVFSPGNTANFTSAGSGNHVVAYQGPLNAPGQDYFYPPLIKDSHTNLIVNGMGRTDLTLGSTTIDSVQSQYNSARSANPNNVIVLHLNGTFTVGASALTLYSNTCVLLNGTIQISAATGASAAVTGTNSPVHVSLSGGIIDGGNLTGNNGIQVSGASMLQVDGMTLRNFGPDNPRTGGSDVIHFDHGSTPYIVTRCTINGGSARGIWLQLSGVKSVISDNEVTAVNQDGVDCDSSTSGAVVKFNYCHDLVRYGVFFEQSASHNLALGNICNNDGRDINLYNNSTTPRDPTAYNGVVCNWCLGSNGLRNGSIGTNVVVTSDNFLFNNVVINASILSQTNGTQNYYSQNYLSGGSLSTAGVESFFNSSDVNSFFPLQDANSGLFALVASAAATNGAPIVLGAASSLGNAQWQLVPTDSGYYQVQNKSSGLDLVVQGASTNTGALIVQWSFGSARNDQWLIQSAGNGLYNLINRLSGLYLHVPGTASGTQLDQQPSNDLPNQQFNLGSGTLMLSPTRRPFITGFALSVGNLVLSGTNGTAGGSWSLLASTNLALPAANWGLLGTGSFDAAGNFILTNPLDPSLPQRFFRLRVPEPDSVQ
jgi:parallel beta-helix repeat protein